MDNSNNETPDFLLFEGTSFSDLMKDIYQTTKKKDNQLQDLIRTLAPMVESAASAEVLAPVIKEFYDVSVRNDEQLVKLAAVIQRHLSSFTRSKAGSASGSDMILSEDEKLQLLELAEQEIKQLAQPD